MKNVSREKKWNSSGRLLTRCTLAAMLMPILDAHGIVKDASPCMKIGAGDLPSPPDDRVAPDPFSGDGVMLNSINEGFR